MFRKRFIIALISILIGFCVFSLGKFAYYLVTLESDLDKLFQIGDCVDNLPKNVFDKLTPSDNQMREYAKSKGFLTDTNSKLFTFNEHNMTYYLVVKQASSLDCFRIENIYKER